VDKVATKATNSVGGERTAREGDWTQPWDVGACTAANATW